LLSNFCQINENIQRKRRHLTWISWNLDLGSLLYYILLLLSNFCQINENIQRKRRHLTGISWNLDLGSLLFYFLLLLSNFSQINENIQRKRRQLTGISWSLDILLIKRSFNNRESYLQLERYMFQSPYWNWYNYTVHIIALYELF
jgi:hypothetical protein